MILQYKGFNNNWCYEEADTITWAIVNVGIPLEEYVQNEYRNLSVKYAGNDIVKWDIEQVQKLYKIAEQEIKKETNCHSDITFLIQDLPVDKMKNVCVVMLSGKNLNKTYVFNSGVYILNNSGGTVQKIA